MSSERGTWAVHRSQRNALLWALLGSPVRVAGGVLLVVSSVLLRDPSRDRALVALAAVGLFAGQWVVTGRQCVVGHGDRLLVCNGLRRHAVRARDVVAVRAESLDAVGTSRSPRIEVETRDGRVPVKVAEQLDRRTRKRLARELRDWCSTHSVELALPHRASRLWTDRRWWQRSR